MSQPILIATFYHFAEMPDAHHLQMPWKSFMQAREVKGTILVTPEGINATISGSEEGVREVLAMIRSDARFTEMAHKESWAETQPFKKTKVKLKRETIPLGVPVDAANDAGEYLNAQDWDALTSQPEAVVVDCRNDYEVKLGQFKGALNPVTNTFKQLPAFLDETLKDKPKDTPVAMYCTGGIRCEKSTAYVKQLGFEKVYHLEGGILKYLEETPKDASTWEGACYVFDDRVAVDHDLNPEASAAQCNQCNTTLIAADLRRAKSNEAGCVHCHP